MHEAHEQAAQTAGRQSFWGVLKLALASELIIRRKISRDPALVCQNVHVHSGHIYVSFAFCQLFLRIMGNFLLNNGVDK